jgi:hypothetical protein
MAHIKALKRLFYISALSFIENFSTADLRFYKNYLP